MIRNNKRKLIISSIIILLPSLIGLILWDRLPEQMASHWGADGNADRWASKSFSVFGMPLIILAVHFFIVLFSAKDPKNKEQTKKAFSMVIWVCPLLSIFVNTLAFAPALNVPFDTSVITKLVVSLMFILIGNYLPKCKQNYTIGIKVKWTLANEENWNATHRFSGKVWVIGGLLLIGSIFLPKEISSYALLILIFALAIIPILYSYLYYKRQVAQGSAPKKAVISFSKSQKTIYKIMLAFAAVLLIFIGFMLFTGDIEVEYGDTSFTIQASYWSDLTVDYDAVNSIEYRDQNNPGTRTNGYGGPRMLMGTFQNDEFGFYTRYSYKKCDACVVLKVEGKTLVINALNDVNTKLIYNELLKRVN